MTITGKYLNELHIKLSKKGFYKELNKLILLDYLKLTRYETLKVKYNRSIVHF